MRFMTRKNLAQRALSLFAVMAIIAGSTLPAAAQRRRVRTKTTRTVVRTPAVRYYTVSANQVIRVRLENQLNSREARIGDRFTSHVTEPVYGTTGVEVIPVGSKVWGRVSSVRRAGRRTPGSISVAFNSVELPNGTRVAINGSLASLQADNVNSDNEGTVRGGSNRKRDVVFIGGGAAAGGIIGAIAGGGKGAAIGAILGGALGTGGRVLENEKEADIKSGTEFGVILNQAVRLPEYRGTR